MYVEDVTLTGFRAIHRSTISFIHPVSPDGDRREFPNINLLVGTNGGGKSTVLKGLAAAALGRFIDLEAVTDRSILDWPRLGSTEPCSAEVTLRLFRGPARDDDRGILAGEGIQIARDTRAAQRVAPAGLVAGAKREDVVLFAYGSRRTTDRADLPPAEGRGQPSSHAAASLLSDSARLAPPERLLLDISARAARPGLLDMVNTLMPPDTEILGNLDEDDRLLVVSQGVAVPWTYLSDGQQSYMAWLFDLLHGLDHLGDGDVRAVRGTVLVDEIDQRMHPLWQQQLLGQLSSGFPNLQFICTAHSPLIAGGLRSENLTLLEPDHDAPGEGAMRASRLAEDLYGRTADGVLTSSYFNLPSSRAEPFREELRDLAEAGLELDDAALEFIRTLAAGSTGRQPRVRAPLIERPDRLKGRRT